MGKQAMDLYKDDARRDLRPLPAAGRDFGSCKGPDTPASRSSAWHARECIMSSTHILHMQEALPELIKNKGVVVSTSSVAATLPNGDWAAYGAAKAAQDMVGRQFCWQLNHTRMLRPSSVCTCLCCSARHKQAWHSRVYWMFARMQTVCTKRLRSRFKPGRE